MTPNKNKVRLLAKWNHDGKDYRLLAVSAYTAGHEDTLILERDDKDTLGDPRWVPVSQWAGIDARTSDHANEDLTALTSLVKKLLSERDQARALVENAAQRERMEAGHA